MISLLTFLLMSLLVCFLPLCSLAGQPLLIGHPSHLLLLLHSLGFKEYSFFLEELSFLWDTAEWCVHRSILNAHLINQVSMM